MQYRLFEMVDGSRNMRWVSTRMDVPQQRAYSTFDAVHHIKGTVHAGFIHGVARGAMWDGGFYGLDAKGNEMSIVRAVEEGLLPELCLVDTTVYIAPGESRCRSCHRRGVRYRDVR